MSLVSQARDLAIKHHAGQRDQIGVDYFASHVEPVAHLVRSWGGNVHQVAAAYLHDVVEDSPVTIELLRELGFSEEILELVEALTKHPGAEYQEFVKSITNTPDAVLVKIADITSNMDPARLFYLPAAKRNRLVQKYTRALPVLWAAYKGR